MPVGIKSSGGGTTTLVAESSATNYTATLPANSGTVVTTGSTAAITPTQLNTQAQYTGFKNRLINGEMDIDQRNGGASITVNSNTGSQFAVDRFLVQGTTSAGVFTAQQSTTTPPAGFTRFTRITTTTASASPASGDLYLLSQIIEGFNISDLGFGTANAATVTVSFWVRSSLTGTFSGSLKNGNAYNRSYPFTFTINAANTWEYETITIAGDTSGTWQTGNLGGLILNIDLGCGSSLLSTANTWQAGNFNGVTGSTRLISTNAATFDITGVQLEKGSVATSFDYRPYGTEFALCQRYYETAYAGSAYTFYGFARPDGAAFPCATFAVEKRAAPTMTWYFNTGSFSSGYITTRGASGTLTTSASNSFSFGYTAISEL